MKKVKWIISFFVITLCFILGSELFQNYINTFTNQFFYFDVSVVDDRNILYEMLTENAKKYDMGLFSIERNTHNARHTEITIYATDVAKAVLEDYYIYSGAKQSLFSGTTDIQIQEFSEIISDESVVRFYFTGTKEQVTDLRDTIYNTYATSYIHQESAVGTEWLIGAIWGVSFLFLLLLTWIDIQFQKKEIFLRLSLGSSEWHIIGMNILTDTIVFAGAFVLAYGVLGKLIFLEFGVRLAISAIVVFCIANAMLYLTLLKYDYKQILYGANINERMLSNSYVLKAITMIVTIASLSVNVALILENGKYLGYYQDIHRYEDFGLLQMSPAMNVRAEDYDDEYSKIKTDVFLEYYELDKVGFSLSNAYTIDNVPIIILNDVVNGFVSNPKLLTDLGDYDYHVFVPEEKTDVYGIQDIEFALQSAASLFGQDIEKVLYEVVYYDTTEVLYFDFLETSPLPVGFDKVHNPIFVYCTLSENGIENIKNSTDDLMHENMFGNFLFRLTEEEIVRISEIEGIKDLSYTSLVSQCEQYKNSLLRIVLLNSTISIFLLLLEMVIIVTIIKMEYMVNAKELSIKKILGYSVFSKNRTIFMLNLLGAFISIVTMIIFSIMFGVTKVLIVLVVGLGLTVLEAGLIIFNIVKLERTNIPKILKGGSL